MVKKKKKLSQQQEFEILKLVLDKFLWLGVAFIGIALYFMLTSGSFTTRLDLMLAGIITLIIIIVLLVKEYHITK
ncbi:unnamed protein product [marine sediment metagenome]|uniref:Uncharacterized protein n=1 Tax=marine sediment metagenome TaxID=412755 RepID=X1TDN0_9ZZZZ